MLDIILTLLMIAAFIAAFVFWIISLVQLILRNDIKNSKGLWAAAIILAGFVGSAAFFMVEGRKKLGIWAVVSIGIIMLISIYDFVYQLFTTTSIT